MKEGVVNIHGREYKTVALRVAEFREVCPDWSIVTELVAETEDKVIMKASNGQKRLLITLVFWV